MVSQECLAVQQTTDDLFTLIGEINVTSSMFPKDFFDPGYTRGWLWGMIGIILLLAVMIVALYVFRYVLAKHRNGSADDGAPVSHPEPASIPSAGHSVQAQAERKDYCVGFRNLSLVLPSGAFVLKEVSGEFQPGSITAVMGPSGSGKTSFLATLAGRAHYGKQLGEITLNGQLISTLALLKTTCGYVPQDDIMMRDMTVQETLRFSALMRLDRSLTRDEKFSIVAEMMALLGLSKQRHSIIGDENIRGISGGQRKRVNVGIELVTDPSILFLDEPTSGLSSYDSKLLMRALRILASRGLTIISVIHQPSRSLFEMFDSVLLLARGGKTVYLGPVMEMQGHFEEGAGLIFEEEDNPVDVVLEAMSDDSAAPALVQLWKQTQGQIVADDFEALNLFERSDMPNGTWNEFLKHAVMCAILPVMIPFSLHKDATRKKIYGGVIGLLMFVLVVCNAAIYSSRVSGRNSWVNVYQIIENLIAGVSLFIVGFNMWKKKNALSISHVIGAALIGPFFLPVLIWAKSGKQRYATAAGIGFWIMAFFSAIGAVFMDALFSTLQSQFTYDNIFFLMTQMMLAFAVFIPLTMVVVSASRWKRIESTNQKLISTAPVQVWYQFYRYLTQYSRNYFGLVFDLGLALFSGLSSGALFVGKSYVEPLSEANSFFLDASRCVKCFVPIVYQNLTSAEQAVCQFVALGNDPYAPFSLMACMGLGLTAVVCSLRTFSNTSVFERDQSSGVSTGAMYVGRSLVHLLVSFISVLLFTLPIMEFLQLRRETFGPLFLLYFLIYAICSGVGFFFSVVIKESLSGLISMLTVLSFTLFNGSLFVYGLQQPYIFTTNTKVIQFILWVPSFLSPMRWSYELNWLILMEPLRPYLRDPTLAYATVLYGFETTRYYQCFLSLALLVILTRIAAYLALVRKEKY